MNAYIQGALKIVEKPESFQDSEGKEVIYYVNHIKTKDGELLVANSKEDFSALEGREGVFELRVRKVEDAFKATQSGYASYKGLVKLTVRAFKEGEEIPEMDIV